MVYKMIGIILHCSIRLTNVDKNSYTKRMLAFQYSENLTLQAFVKFLSIILLVIVERFQKMQWHSQTITMRTKGKGLYSFTYEVNKQIHDWGIQEGIAFLFVQHTSASLVINENYDASARRDMENFLEHIAPEGESWYEHTIEGADDSPAHLRTMITNTSLTIPVDNGKLNLGTWQGIYLAENRCGLHLRNILLRVLQVT
jgi:secondary thiamine-phosphate synthase enzyme